MGVVVGASTFIQVWSEQAKHPKQYLKPAQVWSNAATYGSMHEVWFRAVLLAKLSESTLESYTQS